ncbi:MAG: hypothetical protein ACRC20_02090 [Segniliparus sp.]|uniref:hypothetical protein n=1 Tax=Segniliparus sp. TaxID=2804064 RepID=UPI003F3BF635
MTAPSTGRELIQSQTVAQGLEAVDQVRAGAPAMASVGVPVHVGLSGADLQRKYDQWDPLSLQRLSGAADLLNNTRTRLEELRAHADSTAGQLSGVWPDQAGQAAYGNYQQAAARAQADLVKVGQFSRALGAYQGSLTEYLTELHKQADVIFSNLVGSLGQYRTTGAIVQAVQQIQKLIDQRPAPQNAQSVVDALRQQLQNQVAVPTEWAVTQFQQLLALVEQQAGAATELLANTLQGVDTSPYKVPEFPITCEPDHPDDCGCEDKKQQGDGAAAAASGAAVPAAASAAAATAPASSGTGGGSGGGTGGGSGGGSAGGSDSGSGGGSSGKGGGSGGGSGSGDGKGSGGGKGDDSGKGGGEGKGPDLSFISDIAKSIGDIIGKGVEAAGQLGSGIAGAVGSGLGAVGTALGGTDFSKLAGDDSKKGTDAAADADSTDEAESTSADDSADTGDAGDTEAGLAGEAGLTGEAGLDGTLDTPVGSVGLSADGAVALQDGGAVVAQSSGGPYLEGSVPAGAVGHAEPAAAVPATQGSHGEFEVESNELKVPAPAEEQASAPQVCAVPATTPISAVPSAIPSF